MANPYQDARNSKGRYTTTPEIVERNAEAARLRARGHSYAEIRDLLRFPSTHAVGESIKDLISRTRQEPGEEVLHFELQRLDAELVRLNALEERAQAVLTARHITVNNGHVIIDPETGNPMDDDAPVLQAIDRLIKIEDARRRNAERRARLLGLDAATKADVTVHELTKQDVELQEMLREAKARVAVQEQALRNAPGGKA